MKTIYKLCLLFYCIVVSASSSAQLPAAILWQKLYGGSNMDYLRCMQLTPDGGYILGGSSNSPADGDKTEVGYGSGDMWIIKTDSSGNIQWQNTIGGSLSDGILCLGQTSDSGYILGASSESNISGEKTENCRGLLDYWIIKIDSLGTLQWQKTYGGNNRDVPNSIHQTPDGGYIIAGQSLSYLSGDKTDAGNGGNDCWIIKTDASGNIQWQNSIGGNADDEPFTILDHPDGGYVIGAYSISDSSGDKTENCHGGVDYWIFKIDSSGNVQWQNTIGGSDHDSFKSLRATTDGGYILIGYSLSNISGDKTEDSRNNTYDIWIVKTDSIGNVLWDKTIGGDDVEIDCQIEPTLDGGYIVGSSTVSNLSSDRTENSIGSVDFYILKLDSSGSIQWQNSFGGISTDDEWVIIQNHDSTYTVGGYTASSLSGDLTESSRGNYDFWVMKLTENYNSISGQMFFDANSNNVRDSGEFTMPHKVVTEINSGRFSYSNESGGYNVVLRDTGNFTVTSAPVNYCTAVPATHDAYFPAMLQTDSLNDFAFQSAGSVNDVCITFTPVGRFRVGRSAQYMITYRNAGTTMLAPTVSFYPDSGVTFSSANPVPSAITADSIVWNCLPIAPMESRNIMISVNVLPGMTIGDVINSGAIIEPIAGDANPGCNYSYHEAVVSSSLDPNDIIVDQDTLLDTQFPNPPYLDYIINFQNTGNDTAFEIKILNPIDTSRLQLNTLEFLASSHQVTMNWNDWERNLDFRFDNILLPDSSTDEPGSHGFVHYRIQPKGTLVSGNNITNFAGIYFDYNRPVLTNNAVTNVVMLTGIHTARDVNEHLVVFPNPAGNIVSVHFVKAGYTAGETTHLIIYDILGRRAGEWQLQQNTESTYHLDISRLNPGLYTVEVGSGSQVQRLKLVKE